MATITTDTYLDGGTARTAGETWTINNRSTLTIRTDTRWHANAPAGMTGSLGNTTCEQFVGGTVFVDGTKVRWMAFDSGTGNVPAIGTIISQGGVSGYLLGVWADYVSAPTAVGAAMPATGYIKFREVTGGQFSAGALTGIGANATETDKVGWIEVVFDNGTGKIDPGNRGTFKTRGDWYELGVTNGTRGQTFQIPTNGGGAGTYNMAGIQIETSPGSGEYEWYFAGITTGYFTTAFITADSRSKYFCAVAGGQMIIGSDGTNNLGFLPPSGCKVRMPNIFLRHCETASRASNKFPADSSTQRTQFSQGVFKFDCENMYCDYDMNNLTNAGSFRFINCAMAVSHCRIINVGGYSYIDNCCWNSVKQGSSSYSIFWLENCAAGALVTNSKFSDGDGTLSSQGLFRIKKSSNLTFSNVEFNVVDYRSGTPKDAIQFDTVSNVTINNMWVRGASLGITSSKDVSISDVDLVFKMSGDTNSTSINRYAIYSTGNANVLIDGITFGNRGELNNTHPYSGVIQIGSTVGKNTFRNMGTRAAPLSSGTNATYYPNTIVNLDSGANNVKLQRLYLSNTRGPIFTFNTSTGVNNLVAENIFTAAASSMSLQSHDAIMKNIYKNHQVITSPGSRGSHWVDFFTTDTDGVVILTGGAASATSAAYNEFSTSSPSGTVYAQQNSTIVLSTVGDYFQAEMPYFLKQHLTFKNLASTIQGVNNSTTYTRYEYQIDLGNGWNGTWKAINGANLSAEIIDQNIGFKLKIKITYFNNAGAPVQFQSLQIPTTSSLAAQSTYFYPLDTSTLSFTGLQLGSEVRCYVGTDPATSTEVGGSEGVGSSTFSFQHSYGGQEGYIMIFAMGYQPIRIPYTYKSVDDSILIQQVIDRNYTNPA